MLTIGAKIRQDLKKQTKELKEQGILPAVLYGPKIKNLILELDLKEFEKLYQSAGESTLISLEVSDDKGTKKEKFPVLIHDTQRDPLSGKLIHVDFYQPILTEEVEISVPLVFEGMSLAVKEAGGTLLKEIHEIKIKALPQNLPHDIKVNIEGLKTFEDEILVKDLTIPPDVKILREPNEIVAVVVPPAKVEEELEKPIEEKVEEVEKVETKKEKEAATEGGEPRPEEAGREAK